MNGAFKITLAAALAVSLALVAMDLATTAGASAPQTNDLRASTRGGLSLIVEPGQIGAVDSVLTSAEHSLDMTMYELVDPVAERDLAADAARGVTVRVVLDRNREQAANTPAYEYLNSHGVHVRWAPVSYEATHEKAVVVDAGHPDGLALIMTLNLTARYYVTTRDFAAVDRVPADIAAIESVFNADFAGEQSAPTPSGLDLVWSPGSEPALLALIGSARHSLAVENEEMANAQVVSALATAARAGVVTHVTMTYDDSYRTELSKLVAAGAGVHVYPGTSSALYIHAKVIVVDAGTASEKAFVGSENFSTASMGYNRELGIIITNHDVVNELARVLGQDYSGAPPLAKVYTPPPKSTVTTTASSSGGPSNTSPSGHYYRPGEYCPSKDLNKTITGPYGTMTCEEPPGGGQPRWKAS
jgi:phosphatidylserine/phosphatidylglycerophosphate/cardiolipin synthase-like enzyme